MSKSEIGLTILLALSLTFNYFFMIPLGHLKSKNKGQEKMSETCIHCHGSGYITNRSEGNQIQTYDCPHCDNAIYHSEPPQINKGNLTIEEIGMGACNIYLCLDGNPISNGYHKITFEEGRVYGFLGAKREMIMNEKGIIYRHETFEEEELRIRKKHQREMNEYFKDISIKSGGYR